MPFEFTISYEDGDKKVSLDFDEGTSSKSFSEILEAVKCELDNLAVGSYTATLDPEDLELRITSFEEILA